MSRIEDIGEADGWRCWLCDEPVDSERSVNDDRGPSIDARITKRKAKAKSKAPLKERLAHRACNTGKGGTDAVVPWPDHLFVSDPAVLIPTVERLMRKGGREIMGRCPASDDASEVADWVIDRLSRLEPELAVTALVEPGGGQYLVVVTAG